MTRQEIYSLLVQVLSAHERVVVATQYYETLHAKLSDELSAKYPLETQEKGKPMTPLNVKYVGLQQGYGKTPAFHLYNVLEEVPRLALNSTLSEHTIRAAGYEPIIVAIQRRTKP